MILNCGQLSGAILSGYQGAGTDNIIPLTYCHDRHVQITQENILLMSHGCGSCRLRSSTGRFLCYRYSRYHIDIYWIQSHSPHIDILDSSPAHNLTGVTAAELRRRLSKVNRFLRVP